MSIARLQTALVERVTVDVQRLWGLQYAADSGRRCPRVYAGWPPAPRAAEDGETDADVDIWPYVCVRPVAGDDGEDGPRAESEATYAIVVGVYADDDDGHTDVLLVLDALRQSLLERPLLTATSQRGGDPVYLPAALKRTSWTLISEQPRPYWGGYLTTTWTIPRPVRVDGV